MSEFINTIDLIGDDALVDGLISGSLTELFDDRVSTVKNGCFGYTKLVRVNFPNATLVREGAFSNSSTLQSVKIRNITTNENSIFQGSTALKIVDIGTGGGWTPAIFSGCTSLVALVLRDDSKVIEFNGYNQFNSTPIVSGTGHIYVPRAMIDSYKAATNWANFAEQFCALEDYTVDGTITGDLDESKI